MGRSELLVMGGNAFLGQSTGVKGNTAEEFMASEVEWHWVTLVRLDGARSWNVFKVILQKVFRLLFWMQRS